MKVSINDENNIVIYINNLYISNVNFDNKQELELYFKELFNKLKKYYKINISGYYNIKVYVDNFYGIVIDMVRENIDYFDYFGNQVDMRITIEKNNCFLYQINDLFSVDKDILKKVNVLKYCNKFYIRIIKDVSDLEMANIIENAVIIYDKDVENIIMDGKPIIL